eukprot:6093448-Prymnesium_polylepis.4
MPRLRVLQRLFQELCAFFSIHFHTAKELHPEGRPEEVSPDDRIAFSRLERHGRLHEASVYPQDLAHVFASVATKRVVTTKDAVSCRLDQLDEAPEQLLTTHRQGKETKRKAHKFLDESLVSDVRGERCE